jgi:hypothetical protein
MPQTWPYVNIFCTEISNVSIPCPVRDTGPERSNVSRPKQTFQTFNKRPVRFWYPRPKTLFAIECIHTHTHNIQALSPKG